MDKHKLPNFLIVGAQKAGTTSLYKILDQHPQVFFPSLKEPHFFDWHYQKGLEWYAQTYYGGVEQEMMIGEATPNYLYEERAIRRIEQDLGKDLKLIISLRNPVDRAFSHYQMIKRRGYEKKTFTEAIQIEKIRKEKYQAHPKLPIRSRFNYIERSQYYPHVKRYLDCFGKENILLIIFEEDFLENRALLISKIQEFLQLPYQELSADIHANEAKEYKHRFLNLLLYRKAHPLHKMYRRLPVFFRKKLETYLKHHATYKNPEKKIPIQQKKELINTYFWEDILKLETLIGRKLDVWKK